MSLSVEYNDLATPRVKQLLAALSPAQRKAMLGRLGKELEVRLKAWFSSRDSEPNKRGFPRSHFWAREVRAKTALRSYDADRAVVGIASPAFAHKVTGGTIRPGPGKKFLALPLRGDAANVLPRANTIPGLFVLRSKVLGKAYLAAREGGALRLYWRLVPSVTQAADPKALPPAADLRTAIQARAEAEVQRIMQQFN